MSRGDADREKTDNASVYAKLGRRRLNCELCRPHRGENRGRWVKHGVRKPRYKDHA